MKEIEKSLENKGLFIEVSASGDYFTIDEAIEALKQLASELEREKSEKKIDKVESIYRNAKGLYVNLFIESKAPEQVENSIEDNDEQFGIFTIEAEGDEDIYEALLNVFEGTVPEILKRKLLEKEEK